ncbi:aldehyde dehydrogenase [Tissierella sp. MSJ-40]|uniref:Aldehyde dehydrogenase n=1 Tax=Tissierella simiarum TaxID=2841534 RepID=A0ABS6EAG6_9FIRM|nr:aldehyde dehydrogenase [Tissierella simiarum]MBU5439912.1 aldehyde dehydrogenase [Tissierella simiarum]
MKDIDLILKKQKDFFNSNATKDLSFRINALNKLKKIIIKYEKPLLEALYKDLGKSEFEGYSTEVGIVLSEITHTLKYINKWAKPKKVPTQLTNFKSRSYIYPEPYGNILIMSPWNYPFQLSIAPLIGAISGGNTAIIKPSRFSKYTTSLMCEMLNDNFPQEFIYVIDGHETSSQEILERKFDYIFYTGSIPIGKIVMAKAAESLTPITLELGGKSPCIVDKEGDIDLFAKRIIWGKFLNAGQTCVAPDYVYVHKDVKDNLINRMIKYIDEFYGKNTSTNKEYPKIINEKQFNRLIKLLEKNKVIYGGNYNIEKLHIDPTIMDEVTWEDPVMDDEIFGPILPIMTYNNLDKVIEEIKEKPRPLALYVFSSNKSITDKIIGSISFGGGCINDTIMHLSSPYMPFGGVGYSGMGGYHGKYSFDTFTHYKSILNKSIKFDLPIRYAPFEGKLSLVKKFLK